MGRRSAVAVSVLVVVAGCAGLSGPSGDGKTDAATTSAAGGGATTTATTGATAAAESTTATAVVGDATNGTLTVHFVNVEQSESVLVVGPTGETMLVAVKARKPTP